MQPAPDSADTVSDVLRELKVFVHDSKDNTTFGFGFHHTPVQDVVPIITHVGGRLDCVPIANIS